MRTIRQTGQFRRDLKREAKGRHLEVLSREFTQIVALIAKDQPLSERLRDHELSGQWRDCRDCHIRPDLVLIYRKPDNDTLELVRLGSHSELGI